ncbi:MAG: AEC family transporter [bacterium]|nr:MAG: AEC family transporter [bacterium]
MLRILESISPVFLVIGLGYLSRRMGFIPDAFIQSANRLVYYIAIPILVFGEISAGHFSESFDLLQISGTFLAVVIIMSIGLLTAVILRLSPGGSATFVQGSFHGNLGYVGLAVVFYTLGPSGRGAASVLAGFLILFQNLISISLYTFLQARGRRLDGGLAWKFLGNPIILATVLGLFSSAFGFSLPGFIDRSFTIVGDMALPLALLIIGGSLKRAPTRRIQLVCLSTFFKLILLPFCGFLVFRIMGVSLPQAAVAVILLASPSATISYVMAAEMGGESDLAAAAVTVSTVLSIATYTLWISVTGAGI